MVQKYLNEILTIFTFSNSPKTPEKLKKISYSKCNATNIKYKLTFDGVYEEFPHGAASGLMSFSYFFGDFRHLS